MTTRRIGVILACAVAGGLFGYFGAGLIDSSIGFEGGANIFLLLLAILFAAIGLVTLAMSRSSRATAAALKIALEPGDDVAPERRLMRLQGAVLLISAAAMLLPALGRAPLGLNGETAFAIVLALILVETVVNWRIWRSSDEMMRRMMGEICAIAFWAFQLILFVWAVAVQFGLLARFDPLDVIAAMMAIYIVAAGAIGARRGFG